MKTVFEVEDSDCLAKKTVVADHSGTVLLSFYEQGAGGGLGFDRQPVVAWAVVSLDYAEPVIAHERTAVWCLEWKKQWTFPAHGVFDDFDEVLREARVLLEQEKKRVQQLQERYRQGKSA